MKHKKVLVFIFIFLIVTLLLGLTSVTKNDSSQVEQLGKQRENIIKQNIVIEVAEVRKAVQDESQDNIHIKEVEQQPNNTENREVTPVVSKDIDRKVNNKNDTKTELKEQTSDNKIEQKGQEKSKVTETVTQDNGITNEKEEQKQEEKKAERVVTFKRNDKYIQKIHNYFTNHESDDMKQYGYKIVIDSSIINQTSGFTYSELNMSGYTNKAGTIRIYARDYFLNGNYVETQCFVL